MRKLYIVRLTKPERVELQSVVKKLKGTGQKVRRAQILLKADTDGPHWIDERIAEAYACRTRTVERLRQRFVEQGFDEALNRVERKQPPVEKLLTGDQEARIIATRLGPPPKGYNHWTLRLLARQVVALEIVDSVSYETVRRTLKKTV
jgi:Homeodomain-like domain